MSVADACLGARPTLVRVSRAAAPKGGSVNSRTPLITAFNPKKTGGGGGAARLFRVHTANARARATNVTPGATASSNPPAGSEQSSDPDLDVHKQHASRSRWPQERRINLAARNLRALLLEPGIIQTPCAHDALSASLIEKAGFSAGFMSGFCVSAARLAMPDAGLISYGEMEDVGRHICEAVSPGFPFIGDADDGYGNAMNAKRTVRGYALAGFAGLLMEDQVAPKACGHTRNRRVLPRADAVARVKAACDERDEGRGGDLVIFARSDARSAESLEEALWRVQAFADAGADALFIDALRSREEMEAFCKVAPGVPKMANMLEGGGSTPICTPKELEDMGFKVVAYPLSLLACTVRAMENTLREIRDDGYPDENTMPSFEELKNTVGFPEYYVDEARYDTTHNAHVPRIPRE
mmetsp:Transcript_784/g.2606  ORF Transcript_784/g.2606 Transcript_784/m.2606 type:complete len:412 (-) Transcript_784:553-1788(-)